MILTIITINRNNASGLRKTVESVLVKGIYCLLNNANNALSEAARAKIVSNFKQMVVANTYVEFYNKIK